MRARQIVLDTETTGLDPSQGHRIIEIGGVELVHRRLTGRHFHTYLQPDREIDAAAQQVHGITSTFLADKPRFADVAGAFLEFVRDAELIIHNAPFDIGFLDHELRRWEQGRMADYCEILDTLPLARQLHPGQRNTLDALCKRYNIDNTGRNLHGALLDARLLAEVYLAMTGGQVAMVLEMEASQGQGTAGGYAWGAERPALVVIRATAEECAVHARYLEKLDKTSGGKCLWKRLDGPD